MEARKKQFCWTPGLLRGHIISQTAEIHDRKISDRDVYRRYATLLKSIRQGLLSCEHRFMAGDAGSSHNLAVDVAKWASLIDLIPSGSFGRRISRCGRERRLTLDIPKDRCGEFATQLREAIQYGSNITALRMAISAAHASTSLGIVAQLERIAEDPRYVGPCASDPDARSYLVDSSDYFEQRPEWAMRTRRRRRAACWAMRRMTEARYNGMTTKTATIASEFLKGNAGLLVKLACCRRSWLSSVNHAPLINGVLADLCTSTETVRECLKSMLLLESHGFSSNKSRISDCLGSANELMLDLEEMKKAIGNLRRLREASAVLHAVLLPADRFAPPEILPLLRTIKQEIEPSRKYGRLYGKPLDELNSLLNGVELR